MPSWQKKDYSPCLMHNPSTPIMEQLLCWNGKKRDESLCTALPNCTMSTEQYTTPLKQRPLYLWPLSDIHRDLIYQQLFLELNKHLIYVTLTLTKMEEEQKWNAAVRIFALHCPSLIGWQITSGSAPWAFYTFFPRCLCMISLYFCCKSPNAR